MIVLVVVVVAVVVVGFCVVVVAAGVVANVSSAPRIVHCHLPLSSLSLLSFSLGSL